jgi:hypothetical protein
VVDNEPMVDFYYDGRKMIMVINEKDEELFYLRSRLNDLVQCVPVERFTPYGRENTNYNLFIDDLAQYEKVIVTQHIDPKMVSVIMYPSDEVIPRILTFEKVMSDE